MSVNGAVNLRKRVEYDAFGALDVPFDALYGIQTSRALQSLPISGVRIEQYPQLIRALALIKKAAARVNGRLGSLPADRAKVIERVCDEILCGQHHQHFPVDLLQGGAGVSANLNMNEVIANRGLELMGRRSGDYAFLHPSDDVNRSQSSNDVFPTAIRLALMAVLPELLKALVALARAFEAKGQQFAGISRPALSEDAVPRTLGAEMRAHSAMIHEDVGRLADSVARLARINPGGAATDSGVAAPVGYRVSVIAELAALSGLSLRPAADLSEAGRDTGVLVDLSGVMKRIATNLSGVADDLRLLSLGPHGGLGQIWLPPMQPGPSMTPGMENPAIPDMVNQVAFLILGTDATIFFAARAGQMRPTAFGPLIAHGLLQSVALLRNAAEIFRLRCVEGIEADAEGCRRDLETNMTSFARLMPLIGCKRVATLATDMLASGRTWAEICAELDQAGRK